MVALCNNFAEAGLGQETGSKSWTSCADTWNFTQPSVHFSSVEPTSVYKSLLILCR